MATRFVDVYKQRDSIQGWIDHEQAKVIELWHGLSDDSFRVTVTEYIPREAITDLFWKEPNGWQQLVHTPYGIRSVEQDLKSGELDAYVWNQLPPVLRQIEEKQTNRAHLRVGCLSQHNSERNPIWLYTMRAIYSHLNVDVSSINAKDKPLHTAMLLWGIHLLAISRIMAI